MTLKLSSIIFFLAISTLASAQDRPTMTRQECTAAGGIIVGDIGNGAIHRPNYRCESNGEAPIANIIPAEGEPIAIEGEVCCGSGSAQERPTMTRQECTAAGGDLVGDIGDGAIHRPEYRCESNGEAPIATVVPAEGEPIAREGEVCCGSGSENSTTGTDTGIETIESGPTGDLPASWQDVTFTTDECETQNGQVVTDDSGQGFPDDFVCLSNRAPPHGFIEDADTDNEQVCCGPLMMELTSQNTNFHRPLMSGAECETVGGIIVGDIGNGAIHKEDYICESSGEAPIGAITMMDSQGDAASSSGEVVSASSALAETTSSATAIATEGEVCCASEANSTGITENTDNDSDLNTITDTEQQDDQTVSRQECQEEGGIVVGDIGNGAIFEDDYVCESNGEPPIAIVVAAEGEPIASDGEVCCGPEEETDTTLSAQNNVSAANNNNFIQAYSLMGMMAASAILAMIGL